MIYIYKDIVLKYINLFKPQHIKEYAKANNIYVSDDEVMIIYKFILNNYKDLLNDANSITRLKPLIRSDLYKQIEFAYKENKAKNII